MPIVRAHERAEHIEHTPFQLRRRFNVCPGVLGERDGSIPYLYLILD
jgi:hypothetical protein